MQYHFVKQPILRTKAARDDIIHFFLSACIQGGRRLSPRKSRPRTCPFPERLLGPETTVDAGSNGRDTALGTERITKVINKAAPRVFWPGPRTVGTDAPVRSAAVLAAKHLQDPILTSGLWRAHRGAEQPRPIRITIDLAILAISRFLSRLPSGPTMRQC